MILGFSFYIHPQCNPALSGILQQRIWQCFRLYGNIFYLHGAVKNLNKTVFVIDSYFEHYWESTKIMDFLHEIFSGAYSVLFIGYGLNEYEILQSLFRATKQRKSGEVDLYKHYLLAPIYSKDLAKFNVDKEYLKIYSVKAIPYFIDYEGYGRLKNVLRQFRKTSMEYIPKAIPIYEQIDKA